MDLAFAGRGGGQAQPPEVQANRIGFFHINIAEVQTAKGKLDLFVGIGRTAKFAVVQLLESAG
jgi:hypothetical protein